MRHGCGGPSSRGLDDKSVTKRAHVTRFAGAKLLDDTVAWTGADVGDPLTLRLEAKLDGDRVSVALPAKGRGGVAHPRWPGDDDEELKLARDEQMSDLEFDVASGEGLVHEGTVNIDSAGNEEAWAMFVRTAGKNVEAISKVLTVDGGPTKRR